MHFIYKSFYFMQLKIVSTTFVFLILVAIKVAYGNGVAILFTLPHNKTKSIFSFRYTHYIAAKI